MTFMTDCEHVVKESDIEAHEESPVA
jgi:hypothetical protein